MPLEALLPDGFSKLGVMGWPLLVSSILAGTLILERLIYFIVVDFNGRRMRTRLLGILNTHRHNPKSIRDEILSLSLSKNGAAFSRGIGTLKLIAAVAPLLGLLGTILGIIAAFQVIAAADGPVTPNLIADGLWEALLTTAFGLMIALPAVVAAGIFQSWKQNILETTAARLNEQSIAFELNTVEDRAPTEKSPSQRFAS